MFIVKTPFFGSVVCVFDDNLNLLLFIGKIVDLMYLKYFNKFNSSKYLEKHLIILNLT